LLDFYFSNKNENQLYRPQGIILKPFFCGIKQIQLSNSLIARAQRGGRDSDAGVWQWQGRRTYLEV